MGKKHFIGTAEGTFVADFVLQIEKKTGKTLKCVHVRHAVHDPGFENGNDFESSTNISLEFFQNRDHPPNQIP